MDPNSCRARMPLVLHPAISCFNSGDVMARLDLHSDEYGVDWYIEPDGSNGAGDTRSR
jgi:hypothetical protein